MESINLIDYLSNDIFSKTLEELELRKIKGVYKCNIKTRSLSLDLVKRDKLKLSTFFKFLKLEPYLYFKAGSNTNITLEFIEKHPDINDNLKWDWGEISSNSNVKIDFVKRNLNKEWDWEKLTYNSGINFEDILNNQQLPWDENYIGRNPNLTLEIFENNSDMFEGLRYVINNSGIKIIDLQNNSRLLKASKNVTYNPNVTFDFLKNNNFNVHAWYYYSKNPSIKLKDIKNNLDLPWDIDGISGNPNLTIDFVLKYRDYVKSTNRKYRPDWNWCFLSSNPGIKMDDIENNPDFRWNFYMINFNPNLTFEFYEKYKNNKYRKQIFPNSVNKFSLEFIVKNSFRV